MKRIVDYFLQDWKNETYSRKPLLLRGARQVGKTHAARNLGKSFENFIEINLETDEAARNIIAQDFDIQRIISQFSNYLKKEITPGSTLLFIDEIQTVPKAITALRYFYEQMPELHVIAAGSLLDFAIEQVGMPVGRISSLYMYPMSFLEFLVAFEHGWWARSILEHNIQEPFLEPVHNKLLDLVGMYLAIGGMPAAVKAWAKTKYSRDVKKVHASLLDSYRQDFNKYASARQIKYLDALFDHALTQLSKKFIFSHVGEYQKRELEPALLLLQKAGIINPVTRCSGQGIPLGAQVHLHDFKIIFLDVGLSQASLDLDLTPWLIQPLTTFINKGEIVEAFVGQELLAYSDPIAKKHLYYWRREVRNSQAEVDYLIQVKEKIVPIEVKAGDGKQIKSMFMFLESHPNSSYGIKFSTENFSRYQNVNIYPLYAVAKLLAEASKDMHDAMVELVKT
jgi:uncharacterized protein